MRVFLTGATGFIGRAVARALIGRGHDVVALVRASSLHRLPAGAIPCLGDLRQVDRIAPMARTCDSMVHAAYEYDQAGRELPEADIHAAELLLDLAQRGRHALYTSNAFLLDHIGCAAIDESAPLPADLLEREPRLRRERDVCAGGGAAVRVGVVYGGRGGTMAMLLDALAAPGGFQELDDLSNRWSLIYLEDLAGLYVAVVEGRERGVFHGVDGFPMAAADVIARARAALAALPTRPPVLEEALLAPGRLRGHRHVLGRDIALSSERARKLGWTPRYAGYGAGVVPAVREWAGRPAERTDP